MQTLGVGLPWGIAAALVRPNSKVVSVSGDGGFLFSAQELETAVRLNLNIVHLVWNDGNYDMVKFQEELKYGHDAGVKFGPVEDVYKRQTLVDLATHNFRHPIWSVDGRKIEPFGVTEDALLVCTPK